MDTANAMDLTDVTNNIHNEAQNTYDYYINVRDFMVYPIDVTETVDNLVFDFARKNGMLLVESNCKSRRGMASNARISCVMTNEYTIVRFVDITPDILFDEVLHTCTVEQACANNIHLPVQIYRDTNNKLVQIVVYENDMTHLMEQLTGLQLLRDST